MAILNSYFKILAFALAVPLIWRLLLLPMRVELAEAILARTPEQRRRSLEAYRKISGQIRTVLFLYPVMVVSLLGMYLLLPGVDGVMMLITMLELGVMLATEYRLETWLIRYLTEHEEDKSGQS